MKTSLSEAPSGLHLSPSDTPSSHLLDTSAEGEISVASSTVKSENGTHSGLLVPDEDSRGIFFMFQSADCISVSSNAFTSMSPGAPSARLDEPPGSGPVRESLPSLQFLLQRSKFVSLTYAIFDTSILPLTLSGATISPIVGSIRLRPEDSRAASE